MPSFEGSFDNNWVFALSLGIFVYSGMGVLLPELDGAIGKSVAQGYNKWICLGTGLEKRKSSKKYKMSSFGK